MDSVYGAAHRNAALMDIVDEAWATDQLSDDGASLQIKSKMTTNGMKWDCRNSRTMLSKMMAAKLRRKRDSSKPPKIVFRLSSCPDFPCPTLKTFQHWGCNTSSIKLLLQKQAQSHLSRAHPTSLDSVARPAPSTSPLRCSNVTEEAADQLRRKTRVMRSCCCSGSFL
eukprot:757272-Hanusia_phi.AAC.1